MDRGVDVAGSIPADDCRVTPERLPLVSEQARVDQAEASASLSAADSLSSTATNASTADRLP